MADITISYKGNTIAEVSASGTTTLETAGKYCEDDISISYAKPSGSSYVKIGEADYTISTSSTSTVEQTAISLTPSDVWTSAKMIFISVRDKAGHRAGYYYGNDTIFCNSKPANNETGTFAEAGRMIYRCDSTGKMQTATGQNGIYPYSVGSNGQIRMFARYNSSYTLTIDGTYHVEVYALSWADSSPLT